MDVRESLGTSQSPRMSAVVGGGNRQRTALESLRRLPFLQGCRAVFFDRLAEQLSAKFVPAESVLGTEGEDEAELILLRRGEAKGVARDGTTETFSDGSVIGNPSCLVSRVPWAYTVTATEFCDVQILTQKDFKAVASVNAQDAAKVSKNLGGMVGTASIPMTPSSGDRRGTQQAGSETPLNSSKRGSLLPGSDGSFAGRRLMESPSSPKRSERPGFRSSKTSTDFGENLPQDGEYSLMTKAASAKAAHVCFAPYPEVDAEAVKLMAQRKFTAPAPRRSMVQQPGLPALPGASPRHCAPIPDIPRRNMLAPEDAGTPAGAPRCAGRTGPCGSVMGAPSLKTRSEPRGTVMTPRASVMAKCATVPADAHTQAASEADCESPKGSAARSTGSEASTPGRAVVTTNSRTSTVAPAGPRYGDNNSEALQIWAYAMQEDTEASRRELAGWLDKVPFLSQMDAFVFERLLPLFSKRAYKRGEHIITQNTPAEALHVIYAGYADVRVNDTILTSLGPETILGERAISNLFGDETPLCSATVTVVTKVAVTIVLMREDVQALVTNDPMLHRQLEEMYTAKIRAYNEVDLSEMSVFRDVDPGFVNQLTLNHTLRQFACEERLVTEGEPNTSLYVLGQGSVRIESSGVDPDIILTVANREAAMLCLANVLGFSEKAPSTIIAHEGVCKVLVISQDSVRKACDAYPQESYVFRRRIESKDTIEMQLRAIAGRRLRPRRPRGSMMQEPGRRRTALLPEGVELDVIGCGATTPDSDDDDDTSSSGSSCIEGHPSAHEGRVSRTSAGGSSHRGTRSRGSRFLRFVGKGEVSPELPETTMADGHFSPDAGLSTTCELPAVEKSISRVPTLSRAPSVVSRAASVMSRGPAMSRAASVVSRIGRGSRCDLGPPRKPQLQMTTLDPEDGDITMDRFKKVVVLQQLGLVPEFSQSTPRLLKKLEALMQPRIYLAGQVVLRHGDDMDHLCILQKGVCRMAVFTTEMEPLEGPCILGGMMSLLTPKVMTTFIAQEIAFVSALRKCDIAAILDDHPEDRKVIFSHANFVFSELCDSFRERFGVQANVEKRLAELPILEDASHAFVRALAGVLQPMLLLPGQAIVNHESDAKLFVMFEGYCHVIVRDTVVGTLSSKMVFGELKVYGLDTESFAGGLPTIKPVEFCQVGAIGAKALHGLLEKFPAERSRFEQLVHTRMEASVCSKVSSLQCFDGMPSRMFPQVLRALDRRLFMKGTPIVQQGEVGEAMIIINHGKADMLFNAHLVGMLWAGKTFGQPQMMGVERTYHATVTPKVACHVLLLSGRALARLATGKAERRWIIDLRRRARATLEGESRVFRRHVREQAQLEAEAPAMRRLRMMWAMDTSDADRVLLSMAVMGWKSLAMIGMQGTRMGVVSPPGSPQAGSPQGQDRQRGRLMAGQEATDAELEKLGHEAPPIGFSRGFRKVVLDDDGFGVVAPDAWKARCQSGRLDAWSGMCIPDWLIQVRDEIPKQLMSVKRHARGEAVGPFRSILDS